MDTAEEKVIRVDLSHEAFHVLQEIAQLHGLGADLGKALEIALGNELFILQEQADGAKILVKRRDGSLQKLVMSG